MHKQLAQHRELGVDDGYRSCVDIGESHRHALRLHHALDEHAAAPDEVLCKDLGDNRFEVLDSQLVDEPVERFLQGFPRLPLELRRLGVIFKPLEALRGNIQTASTRSVRQSRINNVC